MGRSRDWRLYARGTALQDIATDDGKHLAGKKNAGKNERWDVKSCDLDCAETARLNAELGIHKLNKGKK